MQQFTLTDLVLTALAAWRLASLLAQEDGPFAMFARLRHWAGVRSVVTRDAQGNPQATRVAQNTLAEGLTCVWCTSIWTAIIMSIPWAPLAWVRLALAASALAVLAQEANERLRR
jgi:hypothetical protein